MLLALVDVEAAAQQQVVQPSRRVRRKTDVALAGNHDLDEDAALAGAEQLAQYPADGDEIGHRQGEPPPGRGEELGEDAAGAGVLQARPAVEELDALLTGCEAGLAVG